MLHPGNLKEVVGDLMGVFDIRHRDEEFAVCPSGFLVLLWSNISSLRSLLEWNTYSMPLYVAIMRFDFSV